MKCVRETSTRSPCRSDEDKHKIIFLQKCSQYGEYPMRYRHVDGNDPQPGVSGSPVIEAQVIIGREPKWQFNIVGALYARCSPALSLSSGGAAAVQVVDTKMVCAIPVLQEFEQLLGVIHAVDELDRLTKLLAAIGAMKLSDEQASKQRILYSEQQSELAKIAQSGLKKFQSGVTLLNIDLPNGLEKLWYVGIVKIEWSLLIYEVQKRIIKKVLDRFPNLRSVEFNDLKDDFTNFIKDINDTEIIVLTIGDGVYNSPKNYFRIDVNKDAVTIDIQDNTGKDGSGKPYRCNGKSLSSVFAKIKLPGEYKAIKGAELAAFFTQSYNSGICKDVNAEEISSVEVLPVPSCYWWVITKEELYLDEAYLTDFISRSQDKPSKQGDGIANIFNTEDAAETSLRNMLLEQEQSAKGFILTLNMTIDNCILLHARKEYKELKISGIKEVDNPSPRRAHRI